MTTEHEILTRAAAALAALASAKRAIFRAEEDVRILCREYEKATGARGYAPHHLAQSCRARGMEV